MIVEVEIKGLEEDKKE